MTLRIILLALSASYLLSASVRADYSVHQVPLIYFRADQFFPANRQYIHSDYYDPSGNHLIMPPSDNGLDVQEGPLSVNEISQIKNIIRERQPVNAEDPSSQRAGRNQDLSQNFNPDLYTSRDLSQNGFQDNAQPNFGDNSQFNFIDNAQPNFGDNVQPFFQENSQSTFPNNGQPGPNFQNNGQPGPNFPNNVQPNFPSNGQSGPNFQNNGQPGPNFQNNGQPGLNFPANGQPGPNLQNNGQPGPNFPTNGQPGPNFQNNGQPGPNFQNNGQPGPNFQNNGQPGPNFQNNGQPGPNFQNNGQPGPNFQNNGQPGPNFQINGQPGPNFPSNIQPGPNFPSNGQSGPIFQNNGQPGLNFQNNGQPGHNFPTNGQPGPNFQNNGQPGPNFQNNGQPGPNFQNNGQPGPNFQINGQHGPNFPNNIQPGPNFQNNGHSGPNIVSQEIINPPRFGNPTENNNNPAGITEFPAPLEVGSEPAPPSSITVSDVIHSTSEVYQGNSFAPPTPEGNAVHVSHLVEHHKTVLPPNDPLVLLDDSFANAPKNALESHLNFPTPATIPLPETPAGHPHPHDRQVLHFNGPFPHPEHPHHFDIASGPFSQNDRVNVHFAGHGPSDYSGNGINSVYGPFDTSFLQQNPIILNNADTFFSQHLPNLPLFPHSNYEQNQFIFPQGFPQSSRLPLSHSNLPEFPTYPPGPSVLSISTPGDVISSSAPSLPHSPSPISHSPDSFTLQPPPSQQLSIPNGSSDFTPPQNNQGFLKK